MLVFLESQGKQTTRRQASARQPAPAITEQHCSVVFGMHPGPQHQTLSRDPHSAPIERADRLALFEAPELYSATQPAPHLTRGARLIARHAQGQRTGRRPLAMPLSHELAPGHPPAGRRVCRKSMCSV